MRRVSHVQPSRATPSYPDNAIGLATTTLQHLITATALNFLRIDEWLDDPPRAMPRRSPFAKLMAQAS